MKNKSTSLSIITPSYNRGNMLKNCFESLRFQSNYDFEWIVVDDGSMDDTRSVMEYISNEHIPFEIRYIWKENGGKHTALNAAHPYIHGKYVLILDSDDTLTSDAVETVLNGWSKYDANADIGILIFLKQLSDGTICARGKEEDIVIDVLNQKRICNVASDCCEVIRTELFKKYPFPVFDGERFLAETALWYRAGLDAKCVYINKPIYICEYLEGGLTKSGKKMRIRNCHGGMYTSYLRMNQRCALKERIKAGLLYVCYGCFAKISIAEMLKKAKGCRCWTLMCIIPGTALYFYWKPLYKGRE